MVPVLPYSLSKSIEIDNKSGRVWAISRVALI